MLRRLFEAAVQRLLDHVTIDLDETTQPATITIHLGSIASIEFEANEPKRAVVGVRRPADRVELTHVEDN